MSVQENKKLVRRHYEEVLSQGKTELIIELYASEIDLGGENRIKREEFQKTAEMIQQIFGEMRIKVIEQIGEGDKVVTRWSAKSIHQGEFMGIPATGKEISTRGIHIHGVREGKIVSLREEFDMFGLMKQIE